jgi:hypothetical protein
VPITTGDGSGLPLERMVTVGEESSVVVRLPFVAPPGRNSCTRPLTRTESPTTAVGVEVVKTKIASEVAGSASGLGSCIQKPFELRAVTTPSTFTTCPLYGEMCVAPWTSWIGIGAVCVVKVKT